MRNDLDTAEKARHGVLLEQIRQVAVESSEKEGELRWEALQESSTVAKIPYNRNPYSPKISVNVKNY